MECKLADSQNDLSQDKAVTKVTEGTIRGASPSDERDAYSIRPGSQSDSRSGSEVASNHARNSRKGKAAQDPEQGSSDSQSMSSTSSAELPQWATKPRITIIDVDSTGKPTRYPRAWGNNSRAVEAPELSNGCVRIVLKETAGLKILFSAFMEDLKKTAARNISPLWKQAAKKQDISDIMRPAIDAMLEHPTGKRRFRYALHRKFSVRYLEKIMRFESDDPGFILQTDLQESCFRPGIRLADPEMNPLLSLPKSFHSGNLGFNLPFWEVYTAVKVNSLHDGSAEGKR